MRNSSVYDEVMWHIKMERPKFRCGTGKAIGSLAKKLELPFNNSMQDWAYEVANADQLNQYIELYDKLTDDDEKFVLMQVIIQATDDKKSDNELTEEVWNKVKDRLINNFELHAFEIFYWSQLESVDLENCFDITPEIRNLWIQKKGK